MTESFQGFPPATLDFLAELEANNNRDWFNKNKLRYESDVLEPALQFIAAMIRPMKKISPYFAAIPNRTGGSLMRPYRDTRFSNDKTPYKTNVGIHFRHEMGKDVHAPGFYLHIDPTEIFFGSGIWHPDTSALKKIRVQIVEQPLRWKRISRSKKLTKTFAFGGASLQRAPRDFDPNHPLVDDLRRKDFILAAKLAKMDLQSKHLVRTVGSSFAIQPPSSDFSATRSNCPAEGEKKTHAIFARWRVLIARGD